MDEKEKKVGWKLEVILLILLVAILIILLFFHEVLHEPHAPPNVEGGIK